MTSAAKIRANQRNALKSTGPKTRAGKRIVARNARHHGLTVPVLCDPALTREVEDLARAIERSVTGAEADAAGHALACRIAEAVIDLQRVRLAKVPLVSALEADAGDGRALARLWRVERYERHAFARRNRAIREFDATARPRRKPRRKLTKQSQRRKANDFRSAVRPTCSTSSCGRSRSERVSKDERQARKVTKQTQPRNANEFSGPI